MCHCIFKLNPLKSIELLVLKQRIIQFIFTRLIKEIKVVREVVKVSLRVVN